MLLALSVAARSLAKPPTMDRIALTTKNYLTSHVNSSEVETPRSGMWTP